MSAMTKAGMDASVERGFQAAWKGPGVLAVLASRSSELETWGRAFARRVRAHPGATLEIYMPAARDGLIERFNQSLAGISIEVARAEPAEDLGRRIILVPDFEALDSTEGMLLARLVSDFPGAMTRLVILVDLDGLERAQRFVEALGRGAQRFSIDFAQGPDGVAGLDRAAPEADPRIGSQQIHNARSRAKAEPFDPERQVAMLPVAAGGGGGGRGRSGRWISAGALLMAVLLVSALIVVLLHRPTGPGASFEQSPTDKRSKISSNLVSPGLSRAGPLLDGA